MSRVRHLIREVHRRSLWQVLGIYLGASWLTLQVVHHITAAAGLPAWVPSFALILLLLFFPVVLATAFVQEGGVGGPDRPPGPAPARAPAALEGPTTEGADAPRVGVHRRLLTWRNAGLGLVGGFLLMLLVVGAWSMLRALGIGPAATLVAQGVLEERERIVLADFGNSTPDATLGDVVTEALRIDLARSPVVSVVDDAFIARVLERMRRDGSGGLESSLAREVALREGFGAVLAGEVAPLGGGYLLTARILTPEGGELASFRQTARDPSELIDAVDRLSRDIRERIGESLRSIRRGEPLDRVSTSSLEALQKYSQAIRVREREADDRRAEALLDEAVALDPEFAMAWRVLGVLAAERSRQVEALERAYELRHRLPDRERYMAEGSYHHLVTGRSSEAVLAYRALLEEHPDDVSAANNLALIYWIDLGLPAEAEELLLRANALQPSAIRYINLMLLRYQTSGPAAAREVLAEGRARFPENVTLNFDHPWALATAAGEYGSADSIARALDVAHPGNPSARVSSLVSRAYVDAVRGRLSAGYRKLAAVEALLVELGNPGWALGIAVEAAEHYARMFDDPAGGLRLLEDARTRLPLESMPELDRPYLALARAYAVMGRGGEARRWLEADERAMPVSVSVHALIRERVRASVALAPGSGFSPAEREASFRDVTTAYGPAVYPPFHLWLAGAFFEERGEPDSALVYYQRYLDEPHPLRVMSDAHLLAPALLRIADLHAERGEPERAEAALDRLAELWSEADPPLRERLARERAAIAARGAGGGVGSRRRVRARGTAA